MLLLVGGWAYTDVLAELARGMSASVGARTVLALALLAGAALGGWTARRFRSTRISAAQLLRCLLGGVLMGWGSLLLPGGNDGLILVGMPLAWPYAWLAFATMCVTIATAQLAGRAFDAPRGARDRLAPRRDFHISVTDDPPPPRLPRIFPTHRRTAAMLALVSHRPSRPALALRAGIGLRAEHGAEFLERDPDVGFIEVHAENYFGRGGLARHVLRRARRDHALSLHGVGLSIGSTDPLDAAHLQRLAELVDELQPAFVSEHLCWTSHRGVHLNDLLPLPLTEEALEHVVRRVDAVQARLRRTLLLENVSSYFEYADSTIAEADFLAAVARRTGCGLLLDVNNVYVSAVNHGFDAAAYIGRIPRDLVHELHLAGHVRRPCPGGDMLIDSHSEPVCAAVWELYATALRRFGAVPTLIEWDNDLPPLDGLLAEAAKADAMLAALERWPEFEAGDAFRVAA